MGTTAIEQQQQKRLVKNTVISSCGQRDRGPDGETEVSMLYGFEESKVLATSDQ